MEEANWFKWYKPWTRCKAKYPSKFSDEDYWGRCELEKHPEHLLHALERGMDIVHWKGDKPEWS